MRPPRISPIQAVQRRGGRRLLDSIDVTTDAGLRDRALIGLMVYSFARIGAALAMRVEDVFMQNRRLWVRLHEKGGKQHEMPCHHNLEDYLTAYIDGCALREDRKGPLFRTIARGTKRLSGTSLPQANAFAIARRRAAVAEIGTAIGNHSFRASGITTYLKNGGTLEAARNYRYGLQVQGDSPPWRPISVFDDGRRVYVVFPARIVQGEMPPLFVTGARGDAELVNYHVQGRYMVVDRLFAAAELRLGSGNRQQVVRIVRTNPTQAADAQPASATGGSPLWPTTLSPKPPRPCGCAPKRPA